LESIINRAVDFSVMMNTPYDNVLNLTESILSDVTNSATFKGLVKHKEAEIKIQTVMIDQLNNIIRGLNNLNR